MSFWRWLAPGLGIKRWLLLFSLGVGFISMGAAGWLSSVRQPGTAALARNLLQLFSQNEVRLAMMLAGAAIIVLSLQRLGQAIAEAMLPAWGRGGERLGERLYRQQFLIHGPRVVALGGGTGLSTLLRGLKAYTANLTGLVCVSDDGGSSGRLRGELGILPPGDIRNCLVALADTEPLMEGVFQYRFQKGPLAGHTLGNLMIGAMAEMLGDFEAGVEAISQVLAVRGRVLPSTFDQVELWAELDDGSMLRGETRIASRPPERRVRKLGLIPEGARPAAEALAEIERADLIVLGPGSLYTSILPHLLIPDLTAAIRRSRAHKVLIVNIMTQPGETDGFTAGDHMRVVEQYLGEGVLDAVLVHEGEVGGRRLERYRAQGARPVLDDLGSPARVRVIRRPLLSDDGYLRHDPERLAESLIELLREHPPSARESWRWELIRTVERLSQRRRSRRTRRAAAAKGRPQRLSGGGEPAAGPSDGPPRGG